MSSMGAVYARVPAGGVLELEEAIRNARAMSKHTSPLAVLCFEEGKHQCAVVDRWGRSDDMPIWAEECDLAIAVELVELSRISGEVIAFYEVDEGLTMGIYGTWRDGALMRNILWADNQWYRVEGEPQPWEKPMFAPEVLQEALQNARDYGSDETAIKGVFEAGCIALNASLPVPNALSGHIWKVYPAPAYGFSPWPRRKELVDKIRAEKEKGG